MVEVAILCPLHAEEETVTIPDSYGRLGAGTTIPTFEGDIPCASAAGGRRALLRVRIRFLRMGPRVEELEQRGTIESQP